MYGADGCTIMWLFLIPHNCTPKMIKMVMFYIFCHSKKKKKTSRDHTRRKSIDIAKPQGHNCLPMRITEVWQDQVLSNLQNKNKKGKKKRKYLYTNISVANCFSLWKKIQQYSMYLKNTLFYNYIPNHISLKNSHLCPSDSRRNVLISVICIEKSIVIT